MSTNFDVIVIFLIFGQFGAIRKTDSRCIVCKIYIFINSNINSNLEKSENRTKKSLAQRLHIALSRGQKIMVFLEKHADISKIKKHMCVYLRTKVQVSNIILMSFRLFFGKTCWHQQN